MNWLDIAILLILVLAAIEGWQGGLAQGIAVLLGTAVGLTLGGRYGGSVGHLFITNGNSAQWLGFALILGCSELAALVVGTFARSVVKALWLGWLDRTGGLALSLLFTTFLLGALMVFAGDSSTGSPGWATKAVHESKLASKVADMQPFGGMMLKQHFGG